MIYNTKKAQNCSLLYVLVYSSIVAFAVFIGLACATMILLSVVHLNALPAATSSNLLDIPVPSGWPVLLNKDGFDLSSTAAIEVSTSTEKAGRLTDISVKFYEGSCDFQYKSASLPNVQRDLMPLDDVRLAFNYNYGDLPIYAAGRNSTLTYSISALYTSTVKSDAGCMLELFLFNDETKYNRFIESPFLPAEGFVNQSGCLLEAGRDSPNVTKNTTIVFPLASSGAYFVSISTKQGLETHTNISANVLEFSTKGLELVDCALNAYVTKCKIPFSSSNSRSSLFQLPADSGSHTVCVWAEAESFVPVNVTGVSTDNRAIYSYTIAGSVVGLVVCVTMLCVIKGCLICSWMVSKRNHRSPEKKLLLPTIQSGLVSEKIKR